MVGERRISISTGPLCLAFPLRPPQSHLDPQTHIPPQTPPKLTYRPHPLKSDIKHIHQITPTYLGVVYTESSLPEPGFIFDTDPLFYRVYTEQCRDKFAST